MKANDKDGPIVLHEAVWEDHNRLADLLVEHGPDAMAKNLGGQVASVIFCGAGEQCGPHTLSRQALCERGSTEDW